MACQNNPKWGIPHPARGRKPTSSTVSTTGGLAKSGRVRCAESMESFAGEKLIKAQPRIRHKEVSCSFPRQMRSGLASKKSRKSGQRVAHYHGQSADFKK